jgi:ligand-binding sensor domain-containing protein
MGSGPIRMMSKNFQRALLFLLTVSVCLPGYSQSLPFRNYTSNDGLLSNYSLALCNDSRGYLWIGSNDGLSRYDGISFRNYTVANGLAFSRVTCILESHQHPGMMWIGTNGGGVSRLEHEKFTTFPVGSTTWSNSIGDIAEDYSGRIWVATSEGVFCLRDSSFVHVPINIPHTDLEMVVASPDSSIWIITDRRIICYSVRTEMAHVVPIVPPPKSLFEACTVDQQDNVWITTSNGLVLKVRNEKIVETVKTGMHFHNFITHDENGSLWAGIEDGILRISDRSGNHAKRTLTRFTTRNGLQDALVVDCVVDREGELWLAYTSSGISKLSDFSVVSYPVHPPAYPPNNSTAVADRGNHIWVCTNAGLTEYWNEIAHGWQSSLHVELKRGSHNLYPRTLAIDQDQTLWMSLENGTILGYRLHNSPQGTTRLVLLREFRPGVHFPKAISMFLYPDDNGLLWCSMADNLGIFLLNPQKRKPFLRKYTTENGLPDMSVRAIFEDRHGNLWFGGYSDGLAMLPSDGPLSGPMKSFTTDRGLPNSAIRAIIEDSLGTLWIGTRYGGMAYFQDSVFHVVSLKDGLLSTAVWCLAQGSQRRLWIGTQLGMQSLIPASRDFFSKRDWERDPVYSCGELSVGSVWFVSTAGLTLYDASIDLNNAVPPHVFIIHFEVNGVSFPTTGTFELSSNQDNCSIEVSGISLRDEGDLRYQYKLLGTNNDEWRPPKKERTFVFASLAPGSYTFVVRAVNTSGVTSSLPATLQFKILPPFWMQWWFIGGSTLCVVFLAVFVVRLRVARLLAIERLRSGIATDLHDDIGSGLTRIAILSDVAYTQVQSGQQLAGSRGDETTEVLGALEKVRTTARGLIETMSDVVWAIDPTHDSLERVVQRLRSFAYELCEGKNIRLSFKSSDEIGSVKMNSESARNVLLLSKEALTNIAKHSRCTSAEVLITIHGQRLVLEISDNGQGFVPLGVRAGNGLVNMQKRTLSAGGSFELKSENGRGTRILASFPLAG